MVRLHGALGRRGTFRRICARIVSTNVRKHAQRGGIACSRRASETNGPPILAEASESNRNPEGGQADMFLRPCHMTSVCTLVGYGLI